MVDVIGNERGKNGGKISMRRTCWREVMRFLTGSVKGERNL